MTGAIHQLPYVLSQHGKGQRLSVLFQVSSAWKLATMSRPCIK